MDTSLERLLTKIYDFVDPRGNEQTIRSKVDHKFFFCSKVFDFFNLYFAKIYCEINKITFWKHPSKFTAN